MSCRFTPEERMSTDVPNRREGSLEAPTRHALDWKSPGFLDEGATVAEMQRIFEICHGCRRCFNLCNAFPTPLDRLCLSP
jgi:hypothetical protein